MFPLSGMFVVKPTEESTKPCHGSPV